MKPYYGYIRVSTVRQTEGYSLAQQRDALEAYAEKKGFHIIEILEEVETAAKRGRKVFAQLLKKVKAHGGAGVLFHKIDRSVRNQQDWADVDRLLELKVPAWSVADDLDLTSRSGRFTGDILAAIASDYIRNLRQEIQKGQLGCLKQGHYPWLAPIGYLNTGSALKAVDPVQAPLVREAFVLYATGKYSLVTLLTVMTAKGLCTRSGRPLTVSRLHAMLTHPFYYGLIKVKGFSGIGVHTPLVTKAEFDEVQTLLRRGNLKKAKLKKSYLLRGLAHCGNCKGRLYSELQKGHVYYRCHRKLCKGTCVREDAVLQTVARYLKSMDLNASFLQDVRLMFDETMKEVYGEASEKRKVLTLRLEQIKARQDRLLDYFLDKTIDRDAYEDRSAATSNERIAIQAEIAKLDAPSETGALRRDDFLGLLETLSQLEKSTDHETIRQSLFGAISNCAVTQKNAEIVWRKPFNLMVKSEGLSSCAQDQNVHRTSEGSQVRANVLRQVVKEVLCV
jgi:site-specific DNA recombinase